MDDCNRPEADPQKEGRQVQIPLWTIVTTQEVDDPRGNIPVQIPLWTIVTWMCTGFFRSACQFRFLYGRL